MGYSLILQKKACGKRRPKGLKIAIWKKEIVLTDDLVKAMGFGERDKVVAFVNNGTSPVTLAIKKVAKDSAVGNLLCRRRATNPFLFHNKAACDMCGKGWYNITGQDGDIWLTDCPVIIPRREEVSNG